MVMRKQTAETKATRKRYEGMQLHAQRGNKAGCIVPWHLFCLHTGVVTWTNLKGTIVEFKIATSRRTDAVDSEMCMRLLQT